MRIAIAAETDAAEVAVARGAKKMTESIVKRR
jgi:hypothetical protein